MDWPVPDFVIANTEPGHAPLVPEIVLRLDVRLLYGIGAARVVLPQVEDRAG